MQRKPAWQVRAMGIEAVRRHVQQMEQDAGRFYQQAASRTTDAAVRKLLGDLAQAELEHEHTAGAIEEKRLPGETRAAEDDNARKRFVLMGVADARRTAEPARMKRDKAVLRGFVEAAVESCRRMGDGWTGNAAHRSGWEPA